MDNKTPITTEEQSFEKDEKKDAAVGIAVTKAEKKSAKKAKSQKDDKDAGLTEEEKKLREEQRKRAARKKRKKRIKMLIIFLILILVIAFFAWRFFLIRQSAKEAAKLTTYTVERRTITETITATGTLMPLDEIKVPAKVKGDILEANFEEGDMVEKDFLLYKVDKDDIESSVRKSKRALDNAKENYDDAEKKLSEELVEYSEHTGTVMELYVEVGDTVNKGMNIARVVDRKSMLVDIPFQPVNVKKMSVGDKMTVIIEGGNNESYVGEITEFKMSDQVNAFGSDYIEYVTVKVNATIPTTAKATGRYSSTITSVGSGSFYPYVDELIKAEYSGEILELYIEERGAVNKGDNVLIYDDEDLQDQKEDAKDRLDEAQENYDDMLKKLDEYDIKSTITGTVVEKSFNVGESIDITGGNQIAAIIYDLSALTFEMNIDELDIHSIKKGQKVKITSEALKGETFYGEVTSISLVYTAMNGTTTYPVTVTITDPEALSRLLPGMNIDAEIEINRVENVIAVPTGAVARGNNVKVIKNPDALKESADGQDGQGGSASGYGTAPADTEFELRNITVGASDDDYIEITEGLEEGDVVIIEQKQASNIFQMMSGGMPGGGMPAGGGNRNMGGGPGGAGGNRNAGGR